MWIGGSTLSYLCTSSGVLFFFLIFVCLVGEGQRDCCSTLYPDVVSSFARVLFCFCVLSKKKNQVTTCSVFLSDVMLWMREVVMVDSLDELKSSRSVVERIFQIFELSGGLFVL